MMLPSLTTSQRPTTSAKYKNASLYKWPTCKTYQYLNRGNEHIYSICKCLAHRILRVRVNMHLASVSKYLEAPQNETKTIKNTQQKEKKDTTTPENLGMSLPARIYYYRQTNRTKRLSLNIITDKPTTRKYPDTLKTWFHLIYNKFKSFHFMIISIHIYKRFAEPTP